MRLLSAVYFHCIFNNHLRVLSGLEKTALPILPLPPSCLGTASSMPICLLSVRHDDLPLLRLYL